MAEVEALKKAVAEAEKKAASKQALRDKLRWTPAAGTTGTGGHGAARPPAASSAVTAEPVAQPAHGADFRGLAAAEDPIRRVMFLAPWGHT